MGADTFAIVGGEAVAVREMLQSFGLGDFMGYKLVVVVMVVVWRRRWGRHSEVVRSLVSPSSIPTAAAMDRTADLDDAARAIADARFGFRGMPRT